MYWICNCNSTKWKSHAKWSKRWMIKIRIKSEYSPCRRKQDQDTIPMGRRDFSSSRGAIWEIKRIARYDGNDAKWDGGKGAFVYIRWMCCLLGGDGETDTGISWKVTTRPPRAQAFSPDRFCSDKNTWSVAFAVSLSGNTALVTVTIREFPAFCF